MAGTHRLLLRYVKRRSSAGYAVGYQRIVCRHGYDDDNRRNGRDGDNNGWDGDKNARDGDENGRDGEKTGPVAARS